MKDLGFGVTQISNGTGIPKCTVSRELKRNSKGGTYDANRAQRLCAGRRHSGHHKIREGLLEEVAQSACTMKPEKTQPLV